MLAALSVGGAGVRAGHMWGYETIVARAGRRLAEYSHLGPRLAIVSQREPSRAPPDASDAGVHLDTWGGRRLATPTAYNAFAAALRADAVVALHDDVPVSVGKNRARTASERNAAWAEVAGAAARAARERTGSVAAAGDQSAQALLGFAPAIVDKVLREKTLSRISAAFAGVTSGFSLSTALIDDAALYADTLSQLPAGGVRLLSGVGSPRTVLQAVAMGVDIFDSDYPELLSRFGYAAAWSIDAADAAARASAEAGGDPSRVRAASRGDGGFRSWVDAAGAASAAIVGGAVDPADAPHGPLRVGKGATEADGAAAGIAAVTSNAGRKGFSGGGAGDGGEPLAEAIAALTADVTKLDAASPRFVDDASPLVSGCTCYACAGTSAWPAAALAALSPTRDGRPIVATGHGRRYIHHLLRTQEMLGRVLLTVHNTHHYSRFLDAVREAVREGRLEEYTRWWVSENEP